MDETIETFLNAIDAFKRAYAAAEQTVIDKDREQTDFVHALELDDLGYAGRAKLATKFRQNRLERRAAKDFIQLHEPLAALLADEANRRVFNKLTVTLGELRKNKKRQENRVYCKRGG